jgi:hypothetical protein
MKRVLVGVALLIALAAPQHYRDDLHTANESARVYAALALVRHHTAALDPVFDQYFPGWRARPRPPNMDVAFKDGHYLLDKAPGLTLLALPVVAALDALGVTPGYARLTWILTLLFAALPTLGWVAWRPQDAPLVLASPWLVYAGLFFSHALAAALVGVGVVLTHAQASTQRRDFLAGLALGGAVLVEYTSALVVVLVLVALLVDRERRGRLVGVCAGGLAPALVLLAWNALVFGGPLHMSYAYKANRELAQVHGHGVYGLSWPRAQALFGLLVSARRGLFFVAPWLALGVVGAFVARGRRVLLAGGAVLLPLALAGFGDWHGGLAFGPRYLLVLLPLLGAGWLELEARLPPLACWAVAGLAGSSFLVCATGAYVYPYLSEQLVNPIFEVNVPVLFAAGLTPAGYLGAAAGLLVLVLALRERLPRAGALGPTLAVAAAILHLVVCTLPASPSPREVAREREQVRDFIRR